MSTPLAPGLNLPTVGDRRMAVRVSSAALRKIRQDHPWVFDDAIASVSHDGAPGDLAVVFDKDRKFAGVGLWDPASPIRLRMVHAGRKPATIDREWWTSRLLDALAIRDPLLADDRTNAFRIVNGESDGFGGLVVDRYADVVVVKLYSEVWFPWLTTIVGLLDELLEPDSIVGRTSRNIADAAASYGMTDGMVLAGAPVNGPVEFRENDLLFEADVVRGQKTGHFLDQRENRQRIRHRAQGARVLDVFSCTGGFTVHAAAGGARTVDSVDLSTHALDATRRNLARNDLGAKHESHPGDAFEVMAELRDRGRTYDLVIVDPPSFAPRQRDINRALFAYERLVRLGLDLTTTGGHVLFASCSSRVDAPTFFDLVQTEATSQGRKLTAIEHHGHALDHPATFPEAHYLKALFAAAR